MARSPACNFKKSSWDCPAFGGTAQTVRHDPLRKYCIHQRAIRRGIVWRCVIRPAACGRTETARGWPRADLAHRLDLRRLPSGAVWPTSKKSLARTDRARLPSAAQGRSGPLISTWTTGSHIAALQVRHAPAPMESEASPYHAVSLLRAAAPSISAKVRRITVCACPASNIGR